MPSSYTPSLRLVLPVQGELIGQWGNTVNNGLTSLVDAAIAGTATVSMSDANHTLTTANEAADQARNMFIRLTGTLSAQRDVICPAVSKLYFVINNTTGGFGINFKTSAGTGVVVPNGARMSLYCDGTNVVAATTPVELADGAVTTPKLANDAVTTPKLANDAVTTPKIPNDAVTFAKIQDIATARILGRATAGAGDVEELTAIPAGVDVPAARLSGTVATARLGTGTADNTTFLRGDQTWQPISATPSTADVLTATAGASVGAVGTYAFLLLLENTGIPLDASVAAGSTRAGSALRYANAAGSADGTNSSILGGSGSLDLTGYNVSGTPSGTWRLMGYVKDHQDGASARAFTGSLWLRIS